MAKNDKFYTFLFSRSTKNTIRIRRVRVSKQIAQTGAVVIFLIAGITLLSTGLSGVIRTDALAKTVETPATEQLALLKADQKTTFDYARPADSSQVTVNSGGPASDDDTEDSAIETQIKAIQNVSDPAFMPNMWAHLGKINNEFGFRRNPFGGRTYEFHPGMDIDGERGDQVMAPAAGKVIKASWQGGYGYMFEIDHGNGLTTRYGHLSRIEVEVGDEVSRGQLLGLVGSTGRSTGPHLHYEIRLNDHPINPRHFLPPEPAELPKVN
jgi:murein DD-endopeptidase MepM/ murein hydrolase activator NlpD